MANFTEQGHHKTIGAFFLWSKCTWNASLYISCIIKHFSIRHCIFVKCSDPHRPSQGVFPSPAIKAHVSLPRNHWYMCWSHYSANVCLRVAPPDKRTAKFVRLLSDVGRYPGHSFQWSVFVNSNRNKCEQTSRSVAGPAMQTGCNTEASWCNYKLFLVCECGRISDRWLLVFHYFFKITPIIKLFLITSVYCYTKIFLRLRHHQVQMQPSHAHQGQPNGGGIPLNIAIPKDCFCSTMGPNNISRLLSSASFIS